MVRLFLTVGAIAGALSVAFGAFASHALKERLPEHAMLVYETGVRYQMYHGIALLIVALLLLQLQQPSPLLTVSGSAFIIGIVLFSGSLYLISLLGVSWMGIMAPVGGIAFLVGWGGLAIAALTHPSLTQCS